MELKRKIIQYFLSNNDNRDIKIAEHFGVPVHRVVDAINDYFKNP